MYKLKDDPHEMDDEAQDIFMAEVEKNLLKPMELTLVLTKMIFPEVESYIDELRDAILKEFRRFRNEK